MDLNDLSIKTTKPESKKEGALKTQRFCLFVFFLLLLASKRFNRATDLSQLFSWRRTIWFVKFVYYH